MVCDTFIKILYDNLSFGIFILLTLISGSIIALVYTNYLKQNLGESENIWLKIWIISTYVIISGIIVSMITTFLRTYEMIFNYSIYINFWTIILQIVATIVLGCGTFQFRMHGNRIIIYYTAQIINLMSIGLCAYGIYFFSINGLLKLPRFFPCSGFYCIIKFIAYYLFVGGIIFVLGYTGYYSIKQVGKGKPRKVIH